MRAFRATAAVVLILFTAVAAVGECITTARLISTRASRPNLIAGPVAWSGTTLGVAKTQDGVPSAVWFAVYDENLTPLAADRLIASNARAITDVEWTGTEFGVFYRTNDSRLLLQRLTMMGEPVGAPLAITPARTVYSGDEIDVEWSPVLNAYVVARIISQGTYKGAWVTVVTRDGVHRTDRKLPVFPAAQSNLSLSVTNTGVIGMFFVSVNDTLSFARFTETGSPLVNAVSDKPGTHIETAAYGDVFVVVHSVPNGPKTEVRWLVVDTSHQILKPDGLLVQGAGDDAWPLSLVAGDGELAVAYIDAEDRNDPLEKVYRLRRFTIDGTLITDTRFAAADIGSSRAESEHDFVWTGQAYLQAAYRESPERLNSYVMRFCPLRTEIVTDVRYGRPGQPIVFTAMPEGGVPSYSYAWTFGDPTRIYRTQSIERTYAETGTYTATLTVTDTAGATITKTYTIEVVNIRRRTTRH